MKDSVKVGLTIKSIDYFCYGLPIINTIKGDTWEIIEQKQVGINYFNDEKLLLDVSNYLENRPKYHIEIHNFFSDYFSLESFCKKIDLIIKNID